MLPADRGVNITWVGDRRLRVSIGDDASPGAWARVHAAAERLRRAHIADLRDLTPAAATLLLTFDLATLDAHSAEEQVAAALHNLEVEVDPAAAPLVEIPACYEGECAPDIEDAARLSGLRISQIATAHSGVEYIVRFIGFSPGFPYLAGLPDRLAIPRLEQPRTRVPAGSVGIAGDQTGIYPNATPGGWRLIARTPLRLFDARRDPPSLLKAGDRVRFVPITLNRFRRWPEGSA